MKISKNNPDLRGQDNSRSIRNSYNLDLNQQSIFDVIILDVHSGNLRGVEIAKQILKDDSKTKDNYYNYS